MKILVADDHAVVREGLIHALRDLRTDAQCLEAADAAQVLEVLGRETAIDLVLLDLVMPGSRGFALLNQLCDHNPDLPVVVLSASADPGHMRKALDLGASGYIPKTSSSQVMLSALRLVLAGGTYVPPDLLRPGGNGAENGFGCSLEDALPAEDSSGALPLSELTARQREVLAGLIEGKSNKQIARDLDLSENTVKIHVAAILRALGVDNRTQAAVIGRQSVVFNNT